MKSYLRKELISSSLVELDQQVLTVNGLFSECAEDFLITSPLPGKWSAKQCLEHLSLTLGLYVPRLLKALQKTEKSNTEEYSQGFICSKMMASMAINNQRKVRKMKTFKSLQPGVSGDSSIDVVMTFATQMSDIKTILYELEDKNLHKPKVTSAAGPLLRFKIGDVIPFLLLHNQRHISQALRAVELCKKH